MNNEKRWNITQISEIKNKEVTAKNQSLHLDSRGMWKEEICDIYIEHNVT